MNESLIVPVINDSGLYGSKHIIDCSQVQLQMCSGLSAGVDTAIIIMAFGLLLQMLRKPLNWIGSKWQPFLIVSNNLNDSMLPELLILVSFLFMAYTRFLI
jgi:hypothetical protein